MDTWRRLFSVHHKVNDLYSIFIAPVPQSNLRVWWINPPIRWFAQRIPRSDPASVRQFQSLLSQQGQLIGAWRQQLGRVRIGQEYRFWLGKYGDDFDDGNNDEGDLR